MKSNIDTLQTNRLILRKFTENDIQAIFEIFSDEDVNTYLPWFALKSLAEAKTFFEERYAKIYQQSNCYRYAVCFKNNNIPIGYVNVSSDDSHDLGYGLKKEFWGQGIITEACQAVIKILKQDGIAYITATHDINNPRSGNVMKNIGMQYCYSYEELVQPKNQLIVFRMYQLNLDGHNNPIYKKYWDKATVRFI